MSSLRRQPRKHHQTKLAKPTRVPRPPSRPPVLRPPPAPAEPATPAGYGLADYSGASHNGAGNLSYVDGHAESHKWLEPRTRPALTRDSMLPKSFPDAIPSPGNRDVQWLQDRTFPKAD